MQAKLLRVLQSGQFERVGGTRDASRWTSGSSRPATSDLEDEVKAGRFRADLFYRLNVIRIDLPPLRERTEDIPLLATHFLEKLRTGEHPPVTEIDRRPCRRCCATRWPGNVRELENAIKAARRHGRRLGRAPRRAARIGRPAHEGRRRAAAP